jgi:hypothetical protein
MMLRRRWWRMSCRDVMLESECMYSWGAVIETLGMRGDEDTDIADDGCCVLYE